MRIPGNDFELAAGFLMTEGVVRDVNDIERIAYAVVGSVVRVDLSADVTVSASQRIWVGRLQPDALPGKESTKREIGFGVKTFGSPNIASSSRLSGEAAI
jgi:formate dehydrogenase assembly factor FdhD